MKMPKELKKKHKAFLSEQGFNPEDFLIIDQGYDYYTFYSKITGTTFDMRR